MTLSYRRIDHMILIDIFWEGKASSSLIFCLFGRPYYAQPPYHFTERCDYSPHKEADGYFGLSRSIFFEGTEAHHMIWL